MESRGTVCSGNATCFDGLLLGGLPLAADGGDDGAFLLEFGEDFVHVLAVEAGDLCNLAGVHGCAEFAHGFEYLFFHGLHHCD